MDESGFDKIDVLPPVEIDEGALMKKVDAKKPEDLKDLLKNLEGGAQ